MLTPAPHGCISLNGGRDPAVCLPRGIARSVYATPYHRAILSRTFGAVLAPSGVNFADTGATSFFRDFAFFVFTDKDSTNCERRCSEATPGNARTPDSPGAASTRSYRNDVNLTLARRRNDGMESRCTTGARLLLVQAPWTQFSGASEDNCRRSRTLRRGLAGSQTGSLGRRIMG